MIFLLKNSKKKLLRFLKRNLFMIKFYIRTSKESRGYQYFFNHIPKCGGTSLIYILRKNFELIRDYPPHDLEFNSEAELKQAFNFFKNNSVDLGGLKPWQMVAGHYHRQGASLLERYPTIYSEKKIRMITFVREPLNQRLSLFNYANSRGHKFLRGVSFKDFVFAYPNFVAKCLGCTTENYRDVLRSYYFIGLVEEFDTSIQKLGSRINLSGLSEVPHLRQTERTVEADVFSPDELVKFRTANELDYMVYEYSVKLFSQY